MNAMEKLKGFFGRENDKDELELKRQFDDLYRTLHDLGQVTDELGEVVDLEELLDRLELVRKGGESMLETVPETYGSYQLRDAAAKLLRGEAKEFDHLATADGVYNVMPEIKEENPFTDEEMELFGDLFEMIDALPDEELVTSSGGSLTAQQIKNRIVKVNDGEADPTCLPRELGQGEKHFILRDVVVSRVAEARNNT